MPRGHDKSIYKVPVCGLTLSEESAVEESALPGHAYSFCTRSCRERLETGTGRYESTRGAGLGGAAGEI